MGLRVRLKSKTKLKLKTNLDKLVLVFVMCFCYNYSAAQEFNVPYKNYEVGELLISEHIDFQDFNSTPFERYLLSTDTFGKYKQIENSSKLYQYLVNIDMINGWEWLGKKSVKNTKEEFYKSFPKENYDIYLQSYPISKHFKTYLLKLTNKSFLEKDNDWGIEYLFLLNRSDENINNITLISLTHKSGFGGSQDYTLYMGDHFYYTRDELYSDIIVIDDDIVLEKPLYQKFKFDGKGHLQIINNKD